MIHGYDLLSLDRDRCLKYFLTFNCPEVNNFDEIDCPKRCSCAINVFLGAGSCGLLTRTRGTID